MREALMARIAFPPTGRTDPPLSCRTSPPQGGRSAFPERLLPKTRLISPLEGEMPAGRGGCLALPLQSALPRAATPPLRRTPA
jgi:hypothetical protein